ncbi:hypothetical protein [Torque teno midi virus 10]|uniref:Hepatitis TT virus Orf2/Gyrovirus Vp2 N-terminal domain-containing protein n=2 Tax=Torque teno midi virus 10 TaxID=2065051 RepID=A7VLY5_9VIRU|nr:hypothetical protein [Torque teno midi virus 10]BAF76106.1 hypothetical protein [Torque teno midi virus 10]
MSRFYTQTKYNGATLNQMWMSMIADSHDIHCDCKKPFAHLLDNIFPEGHTDRNKTVAHIINRDYKECLSGGEEEDDPGIPVGASAATAAGDTEIKLEEHLEEDAEEIEKLLAAAEENYIRWRNTKEKEKDNLRAQKPTRRDQRSPKLHPLTMPNRNIGRGRPQQPPAAHPQAKAQAAAAQAQHLSSINRPQNQAKLFEATNRQFTVEPFKPGFEIETEQQLAIAFCRPPRTYKNDPPFYPWLPPTPLVNFNLNYKC